jgi:deferrochelatase/peroxidase EfeB
VTPQQEPEQSTREEGTREEGADPARRGISRRSLFGALGSGAAGLAAGGSGGLVIGEQRERAAVEAKPGPEELTYDFAGEHQAGIVSPAQDRMHFASFDLREDTDRDDLIELLEDWTAAAARLTLGGEVSAKGAFGGGELFPPDDTGEAYGLGPSGLTLTFGFGRSLFLGSGTAAGEGTARDTGDGTGNGAGKADRFGLRSALPAHFTELPVMVNDFLQPERSDGDLCIQACAEDPQVAVHAIRNLTRIAVGKAALRWSQLGFGRTSSTSTSQSTPRNLFGQKDGTSNIKAEEPDRLDEHVWITPGQGPEWAVGGSYLIARRISMTIEVWDSLQLGEQERVTGRDKAEGAPLSGGDEFTAPDFSQTDERGRPLIDERSHVARVHPENNDGIRMLRRGYNFVDGNDAQGRLDAGLFFIAFVNAPERFARVHTSMARDDMFVEYLKTTGSAVFFVPPGVQPGTQEFIGQALFEAQSS